MKRAIAGILSSAVFLTACMKEELPVPAQPRGDGLSLEICMGTVYQDQLWMDLGEGAVVSTNVKTDWDLAFESAPDGWRIMLNGSRLMTVWDRGAGDITQPMDTLGMAAGRRIDAPSGNRDSTAFGDWRGSGSIFIVDLGFGPMGEWLGARKVRVLEVDATRYLLQSAGLDGTDIQAITVPKDASRSFTCYRFSSGVVPIEPQRTSWDLVFTQYTHQFYEPFLPYIVTGVLSSTETRVATVRGRSYQEVMLTDTVQFPFSSARDAIGYDWKTYSFETASYTVDQDKIYIIQDAEGYFHKLRFLDFYNTLGQVGCPRFEVRPL